MAFEEYVSKKTGGGEVKDPNFISFGVAQQTGKQTGFSMLIGISSPVAVKHGWSVGDRIATHFGTGEDKGKLLLKKTDQPTANALTPYGAKPKEGERKSVKLLKTLNAVGPIKDFAGVAIKGDRVKFEWDEVQQGLLLDLPESFFTVSGQAS